VWLILGIFVEFAAFLVKHMFTEFFFKLKHKFTCIISCPSYLCYTEKLKQFVFTICSDNFTLKAGSISDMFMAIFFDLILPATLWTTIRTTLWTWSRFECAVSGVRHPQHTQTDSNSSTMVSDSSNGVTNTRCCKYSCMRS
jgi:hypothetical protein